MADEETVEQEAAPTPEEYVEGALGAAMTQMEAVAEELDRLYEEHAQDVEMQQALAEVRGQISQLQMQLASSDSPEIVGAIAELNSIASQLQSGFGGVGNLSALLSRAQAAIDSAGMAVGEYRAEVTEQTFADQEKAREFYRDMLAQQYGTAVADATYHTLDGFFTPEEQAELYNKYPNGATDLAEGVAGNINEAEAQTINQAAAHQTGVQEHVEGVLAGAAEAGASQAVLDRLEALRKLHNGVLPKDILAAIQENPNMSVEDLNGLIQPHMDGLFSDIEGRYKGAEGKFEGLKEQFTTNGILDQDKLKDAYFDLAAELEKLREQHGHDLSTEELLAQHKPELLDQYQFVTAAMASVTHKTAEMVMEIAKDQGLSQALDQQLSFAQERGASPDEIFNIVARTVEDFDPELAAAMRNDPAMREHIMANAASLNGADDLNRIMAEYQGEVGFELTRADAAQLIADRSNRAADALSGIRENNPEYAAAIDGIMSRNTGFVPADLATWALDVERGHISGDEALTQLNGIAAQSAAIDAQVKGYVFSHLQNQDAIYSVISTELANQGIDINTPADLSRIDMSSWPTAQEYSKAFGEVEAAIKAGTTHELSADVVRDYALGRARGDIEMGGAVANMFSAINHAQEKGSALSPEGFVQLSHTERMAFFEESGIAQKGSYAYNFTSTISKAIEQNPALGHKLIGIAGDLQAAGNNPELRAAAIQKLEAEIGGVMEAAGFGPDRMNAANEAVSQAMSKRGALGVAPEMQAALDQAKAAGVTVQGPNSGIQYTDAGPQVANAANDVNGPDGPPYTPGQAQGPNETYLA